MPFETVKLKNGAEEAMVNVAGHMMSLKSLLEEQPTAFYELVMAARDRKYVVSEPHIETLRSYGFLQGPGGTVHDSTENIILSAVVGDGEDIEIVSPVKG